ncbi:hypothetical protein RN629_13445 [Sphingomonadaceae bacterium jetA1]|uniref:hypothetical protein n=1 Tax=Facivitalis istanbulensis TaxID=3075838 RepID=UPI00346B9BE4
MQTKILIRVALGVALLLPAAAPAQPPRGHKPKATKAARAAAPAADAVRIAPSAEAVRVIDWISATGDNHALPWVVVDKRNAAMFLFDARGKPRAAVPVLVGIATGDEATPGVGSKRLGQLGPAEKTTPAGRYLARFGIPVAGERILWVDYATSVAIHPIPGDAGPREKRRERMLSSTPDDNRITFGCINVPKAFYAKALRPLFQKKGGYVYILPDSKPIEQVFPNLRMEAVRQAIVPG